MATDTTDYVAIIVGLGLGFVLAFLFAIGLVSSQTSLSDQEYTTVVSYSDPS